MYNIDNYANELKYKLQVAHHQTKEIVHQMKLKTQKHYDKKLNEIKLKIGNKIKVRNEPYNKFKNIYSGPFNVLQIEDKNIVIDLKGQPYTIHKDRVLKYYYRSFFFPKHVTSK